MQQLQDSLLRVSDVTNATKLSRTTIWRLEQEGKFPKRVQISKGVIGWWKSSIDAWMDDLKSNSSHTAA